MKKILLYTIIALFTNVYANAAKDVNAWKKEKTLDNQFNVFKKNLNLWDGYLFFKENQANEFYNVLKDTVNNLEGQIVTEKQEVTSLNKEITDLKATLATTEAKLEASLSREFGIQTLGSQFDKKTFPTVVYTIISVLAAITAFAFFLFFRSNYITKETKFKYHELDTEFEAFRKRSLDRELKLNRELQNERNKTLA